MNMKQKNKVRNVIIIFLFIFTFDSLCRTVASSSLNTPMIIIYWMQYQLIISIVFILIGIILRIYGGKKASISESVLLNYGLILLIISIMAGPSVLLSIAIAIILWDVYLRWTLKLDNKE